LRYFGVNGGDGDVVIRMRKKLKKSEKLQKNVHILNFGRDGYGLKQIFKLADYKVSKWKPDFFIITFTTDDLDRRFFWRTVVKNKNETRVLTSVVSDPTPPGDKSTDTYLINNSINQKTKNVKKNKNSKKLKVLKLCAI
jgi:hypothetical protein